MFGIFKIMSNYQYYNTYCKDYYSVVAGTDILTYENVLEKNGEPKNMWEEERTNYCESIYLKYDDGRLFVLGRYLSGYSELQRIEIVSSDYRFGKKKIGIGTEKEIIEQVYKNSYRGLYKDKVNGNYYAEDGNCEISFRFDEEEKVDMMIIGDAEIYHGLSGWKKIKKSK